MARARLYERLRRKETASTVRGSLPVLFFGDLFSAAVATVGLNPSPSEYLNRHGVQLTGHLRRFETLESLRAADRSGLTDEQCEQALETMRAYFQVGKPIYSWFNPLARVMEGMGLSYRRGEVAHLDLVQEATQPTWSALQKVSLSEAGFLRAADLPFLAWELETFPLRVVACNGRSVWDAVLSMTGGSVAQTGQIALVTWFVGVTQLSGRKVGLAGWNRPLARPTGLGAEGEAELGGMLADALHKLDKAVW